MGSFLSVYPRQLANHDITAVAALVGAGVAVREARRVSAVDENRAVGVRDLTGVWSRQ